MARKYLTFEGVKIFWKNFSGKPTKVNKAGGVRDFALPLTDEMAEELLNDGWNVKYTKGDPDRDMPPAPFIKVKVNFNEYGPDIYMVNAINKKKTKLTPMTVQQLDAAFITSCDIVIAGNPYDVQGRQGISAYLNKMFAVIQEDEFTMKYSEYEEDDDPEELPFG